MRITARILPEAYSSAHLLEKLKDLKAEVRIIEDRSNHPTLGVLVMREPDFVDYQSVYEAVLKATEHTHANLEFEGRPSPMGFGSVAWPTVVFNEEGRVIRVVFG